jgi:CheY-like chemotaxis protein
LDNNKKLLIVDDILQVRFGLTQYFTKYDYIVSEADCGVEGIKRYKEDQPHLIILDYELRDMNCFQFLIALRKHEGNHNDKSRVKIIPAIVISGCIQESQVLPVKAKLGILGFMKKPLILPELLIMVQESIEKEHYIVDGVLVS